MNFELIILNYMKKTYISPATEIEVVSMSSVILTGSLNVDGEGGHATFHDEDAEDDALVKSDNWNDIWE